MAGAWLDTKAQKVVDSPPEEGIQLISPNVEATAAEMAAVTALEAALAAQAAEPTPAPEPGTEPGPEPGKGAKSKDAAPEPVEQPAP